MATIQRPALTSQQQRKRPIGPADQPANLLATTLSATPATLDLPLLAAKIFDSAPRRPRWQPDSQQSQGFIVYEVPYPEIVRVMESAPRRAGRLSVDQRPDLLATTLAQSSLALPLLAARLDVITPARKRQAREDQPYIPLTMRVFPGIGQLNDSAPRSRRQISVDAPQRPLTIAVSFFLQVADALHDHTADALTLQLAGTLAVADALHAHSADELSLQQAGTLSIADALHGHAADNIALVQDHLLALSDATHGHSVDNVTLSTGLSLELQDALHGHFVDQPSLTQAHVLVVSEALHGHTADLVAIFNPEALIVSDALHAHLCDAVGVAPVRDATRRVFVVAVNRIVRVH